MQHRKIYQYKRQTSQTPPLYLSIIRISAAKDEKLRAHQWRAIYIPVCILPPFWLPTLLGHIYPRMAPSGQQTQFVVERE